MKQNYRDRIDTLICHCALKAAKDSLDEKRFQEFSQNFLYELFEEKDWLTMNALTNATFYVEDFR